MGNLIEDRDGTHFVKGLFYEENHSAYFCEFARRRTPIAV